MKQPYKHWKLIDFEIHFEEQNRVYNLGYTMEEIKEMIYSKKWDPIKEFNGCNVVQDDLHPFIICFIHDYRWIAEGRTNKADKEFKNNLRKFGYSTFKATMYYFSVRLGSVYFKLFK